VQVAPQDKANEGGVGVADRRRGRRQRVLKKALIVFGASNCDMACHIIDTSETGAKLVPADILACPNEFVLMPQTGEPRHCAVMWRKGTQIGVHYLTREQQTTPNERRHNPRRRTMQQGLIVFNNGHSNMRCRIVDTSDVGAKLIPADLFTCPREFVLKPEHGGPRLCAVVWRKATAIGVRFL
jgi:hypothetical protein